MLTRAWEDYLAERRTFVIGEAGVNHNGDMALAKQLVDLAQAAGCDAVKFQTFKAERLVSVLAAKAQYQQDLTDKNETQFEMIRKLELDEARHQELLEYCRQKQILFLSSPFDEDSVDLLDRIGVPMFKIPSGEMTNLPFLQYVAGKKRLTILSTGMCTLAEVHQAMDLFPSSDHPGVALLHCLTSYPAPLEQANLQAITTLEREFRVPVGFSDHTVHFYAAVAAVSLGARIIEKHFTLDKKLPGPDHKASLAPEELHDFVRVIRMVDQALGDGVKRPAACEAEIAMVARKSIVAARDIAAGTVLTPECLAIKRPGTGLPPVEKSTLIGRTAKVDIRQDRLITLEMLS